MSVVIGYCGVCCDHCGMRTRIPEMAKNLKIFIDAYGYAEWIHNVTRDFNFEDLMKGLNWFANSSCPGCVKGEGMPVCEVRIRCLQKKLKNCYNIGENYETIGKIGYEKWLRGQEKKTRENFDNIEYLEKEEANRKYGHGNRIFR